jgi:hypothetical protein
MMDTMIVILTDLSESRVIFERLSRCYRMMDGEQDTDYTDTYTSIYINAGAHVMT